MKKNYIGLVLFIFGVLTFVGCSNQERKPFEYPMSYHREFIPQEVPIIYSKAYKAKKNHRSKNIVIGMYPSKMEDVHTRLDFDLFHSIVFHTYELNDTTGGALNEDIIEKWQTTPMIDSAHNHGCQALLCITNYSGIGNKHFLESDSIQNVFIQNILQLLHERSGDGLDIDFPSIPHSNRNDFIDFIRELSIRLKLYKPSATLLVTLPFLDKNDAFDVEVLSRYVDFFVLSVNDFANDDLTTSSTSPTALLGSSKVFENDNASDISYAVEQYKNKNLKTYQLILELPFYTSKKEELRNDTLYKSFSSYADIRKEYKGEEAKLDKETGSSYFLRNNPNGLGNVKFWFDDSTSLGLKYDWALSNQLAGVNFWGLGFDGNDPALWTMIENRAATDPATIKLTKTTSLFSFFNRYEEVLKICLSIVIAFLLLGIFFGMLYWLSRDTLTEWNTIRLYYIFGLFGLIALGIWILRWSDNYTFAITLGLMMGGLITYYINAYIVRKILEEP